jgi:hypothetical protein
MGHICCATAALLLAQGSWRTFTPPAGEFSVSLPGPAVAKKQTAGGPIGSLEVRLYVCEIKGGAYVVSVTEFPEAEGSAERRLNNARAGALESVKGKLLHERKIKLDGFPGRELWIDAPKAGLIHTRIYAVKGRLYQTLALGPNSFVETKDTARFLDSFKVIK